MKLVGATILIELHGTDLVNLKTELPVGVWPFDTSEGGQSLRMEVAKGKAVEYVKKHFVGKEFNAEDVLVVNTETGTWYDIEGNEIER